VRRGRINMIYPFNWKSEKEKRRRLRNNMSQPEYVLWYYLKNKQLKGYKFRRQVSVGKYVVDFYCPKLKLAIELDGDSHYYPEAKAYDSERSNWIKMFGIKFLRFTNKDVIENKEAVIETIARHLPPLTPPNRRGTRRSSSPLRGGEEG